MTSSRLKYSNYWLTINIFVRSITDYDSCTLTECEYTINLVDRARLVKLSSLRATPDKRKIIEKETQQILVDGIIRQSTGEGVAPVVLD